MNFEFEYPEQTNQRCFPLVSKSPFYSLFSKEGGLKQTLIIDYTRLPDAG
jgi:hypothetical protein